MCRVLTDFFRIHLGNSAYIPGSQRGGQITPLEPPMVERETNAKDWAGIRRCIADHYQNVRTLDRDGSHLKLVAALEPPCELLEAIARMVRFPLRRVKHDHFLGTVKKAVGLRWARRQVTGGGGGDGGEVSAFPTECLLFLLLL